MSSWNVITKEEWMSKWLLAISAAVVVSVVSCTESPVSNEPDQRQIAREVNWALLELNNLEAMREVYWQDVGEDPDSIARICLYLDRCLYQNKWIITPSDSSYTAIMPSYRWWQFDLVSANDTVHEFTAVSTAEMATGAGRLIRYNVNTGSFVGYGLEYADPAVFTQLLGVFINPLLIFDSSASFDPTETRRRMEIVREVNWAAESFLWLKSAITMFVADYGRPPTNYLQLDTLGYITPPQALLQWWEFAFELNQISEHDWSILKLHAISTDRMAGGAGDSLTYFPGRIWYGDYGRWEYVGGWARWKSPFVGL